jgi:hypothetical protein
MFEEASCPYKKHSMHVCMIYSSVTTFLQGCQMACFQTKNLKLGKFWSVFQWKLLVYFMDTWSILRTVDIFYGHLV